MNRDGVGQYGVEQYYQDMLAGQPKVVLAARSISGRPPDPTRRRSSTQARPARTSRLTIDAGLQLALEQEVMAASVADRAQSVSAIVIDP